MWAILTDPEKKGNAWTPEEFFASGRAQVDELMTYLDSLDIKLTTGSALDFGCGLGRLSQALCQYFPEVHGVDIAPTMIAGANEHNRHAEKCIYHLNTEPDLRLFSDSSMSFVYTLITLQHIPGHLQLNYIREFLRVLKPGGATLFRTMSASSAWRYFPARILDLYRMIKYRRQPFMGAYGVPILKVIKIIREAGCELVELKVSPCSESRYHWLATQYCVQRRS